MRSHLYFAIGATASVAYGSMADAITFIPYDYRSRNTCVGLNGRCDHIRALRLLEPQHLRAMADAIIFMTCVFRTHTNYVRLKGRC